MADVKITKKMVLEAVRKVAESDVVTEWGDVTVDDVIKYVDTTIAQLDTKAAKAKAKAAKTKAEGDALRDVVEGALTEDLQTIDAITAAVNTVEGYEDITKAKVTARLTQLVKADLAHKEQVKNGDRKVMAYAGGPAAAVESEEEDAE